MGIKMMEQPAENPAGITKRSCRNRPIFGTGDTMRNGSNSRLDVKIARRAQLVFRFVDPWGGLVPIFQRPTADHRYGESGLLRSS